MDYDICEPAISRRDILFLDDPSFAPENVCLVTGAAGGIGRASALAAAANGLTVFGIDLNPEGLEETRVLAQALGGRMICHPADLTVDSELEGCVAAAAKEGRIKYLLNIAGVQHIDFIEDFPMERFDFMQRLMVRAPFYLSKLCLPRMKANPDGRGVIGNMASIHAHICTVAKTSYNITKFSLKALAQSISAEGGGQDPGLHRLHRVCQDGPGPQPDSGPGQGPGDQPRGGGPGGHDGPLPGQGDDEPHRGGQHLSVRPVPVRRLPGGGRSAL